MKMVGKDWENSLNGPNSSKSLPNCAKMSQNVPKCPLKTHRCPNGLVFRIVAFLGPRFIRCLSVAGLSRLKNVNMINESSHQPKVFIHKYFLVFLLCFGRISQEVHGTKKQVYHGSTSLHKLIICTETDIQSRANR